MVGAVGGGSREGHRGSGRRLDGSWRPRSRRRIPREAEYIERWNGPWHGRWPIGYRYYPSTCPEEPSPGHTLVTVTIVIVIVIVIVWTPKIGLCRNVSRRRRRRRWGVVVTRMTTRNHRFHLEYYRGRDPSPCALRRYLLRASTGPRSLTATHIFTRNRNRNRMITISRARPSRSWRFIESGLTQTLTDHP